MEQLIHSLRVLKNWPADKAQYAATIIVLKKGRNLRLVVQALAMGATYREALRAGEVSIGHAAGKLHKRTEATLAKLPLAVQWAARVSSRLVTAPRRLAS